MTTVERVDVQEGPHEDSVARFCAALHPKFLEALSEGTAEPTEKTICPPTCEGAIIEDFHVLGVRVPGMTRVACTRPCEPSSQNTLQTSL